MKKGQTTREHTDIATTRSNRPSGPFWWKLPHGSSTATIWAFHGYLTVPPRLPYGLSTDTLWALHIYPYRPSPAIVVCFRLCVKDYYDLYIYKALLYDIIFVDIAWCLIVTFPKTQICILLLRWVSKITIQLLFVVETSILKLNMLYLHWKI